jgi:hypothetical protein
MSEDVFRAILRDIAEEAVPVNFADKAMSGAARRRAVLIATAAVAVVALALGVTPLALASINPQHGGVPGGPGMASASLASSSSARSTTGQSFHLPDPGVSAYPTPGPSEKTP